MRAPYVACVKPRSRHERDNHHNQSDQVSKRDGEGQVEEKDGATEMDSRATSIAYITLNCF